MGALLVGMPTTQVFSIASFNEVCLTPGGLVSPFWADPPTAWSASLGGGSWTPHGPVRLSGGGGG